MKCKSSLRDCRGLTIVELMISLAILSLIIAGITSLFVFGSRAFNKSESVSQVQFDVRMVSDFLTVELRNATAISLTPTNLPLSVNIDRLSAKYPLVRRVSFWIKPEGSRFLVEYLIEGWQGTATNPEHHYELRTAVLLNRITFAEVRGPGEILFYSK